MPNISYQTFNHFVTFVAGNGLDRDKEHVGTLGCFYYALSIIVVILVTVKTKG